MYRLVTVALVAALCCGSVWADPQDVQGRETAVWHLEGLWQWLVNIVSVDEIGQFIEPNGEPELGEMIEPNGDELGQFIEPHREPEIGEVIEPNGDELGEMIEPSG